MVEDAVTVVALVADLMDRSRIASAIPDAQFTGDPHVPEGTDIVIVDLAAFGEALGAIRANAPHARVVAYGPHVDEPLLARARADGADAVLPRSAFFRNPEAALAVSG